MNEDLFDFMRMIRAIPQRKRSFFSVSDPEQTALGRELVARGWAVYELGDVCGEECHHFKLTKAGRAAFCAEKRRRIDGGEG